MVIVIVDAGWEIYGYVAEAEDEMDAITQR